MFILFVKKGQIIIFNFELWFNPSLYEKRVIFFSITIISNTCIYQKVGLSWNLHWLFCMCVWLSTISPARRNFFQLKNFQIVCCSFITVGKILIWDSTVFYQILRNSDWTISSDLYYQKSFNINMNIREIEAHEMIFARRLILCYYYTLVSFHF